MSDNVIQFVPRANANRVAASFELLPDPAYTVLGPNMVYHHASDKLYHFDMPSDATPSDYTAPSDDCA